MMAGDRWYKDGLRFECTQCGDCCTGAPGFVWVNQEEIDALAAKVGISVDEFEKKYVRKVSGRRSLVEFPNGDCVFFDTEKRNCSVYEARPRQCRTWPWWNSNLESKEAWKETCEVCPGSGKGKLYSIEHIETQRKIVRV
jgi:Fe-S-cluster containining protein